MLQNEVLKYEDCCHSGDLSARLAGPVVILDFESLFERVYV